MSITTFCNCISWPCMVVQTLDSAIHWILITIQRTSSRQTDCIIQWIEINPMNSVIHLLHNWVLVTGLASFLTSCRPGWLSFLHILKIALMTSVHWPHQHFELLAFRHTPTVHNLLQTVEWSNQKFVDPGLQVFGLATPLLVFFSKIIWANCR